MPWFEVTLSDGTTSLMQARTITQLRGALYPVVPAKIERGWHCTRCRNALATVEHRLCQPCWEDVLTSCRDVWKDTPMSEQAVQELAMSFFVDG